MEKKQGYSIVNLSLPVLYFDKTGRIVSGSRRYMMIIITMDVMRSDALKTEVMDNALVHQFFTLNELPLPIAERPKETSLAERIEKVADFASRNGPDFVQLLENEHYGNAEYQFLFGGEGHSYYRWYLYHLITNGSHRDPAELASSGAFTHQLPPQDEMDSDFHQLLNQLDGSKETTRSCMRCFLKNVTQIEHLTRVLHQRVMLLTDVERQLDIAYLISDILLKGRNQCSSRDHHLITDSLQQAIGGILARILQTSNRDDEVYRRLNRLCGMWSEQDIYSGRIIDAFGEAMIEGKTSFGFEALGMRGGMHADKYPRTEERFQHRRSRSRSRERRSGPHRSRYPPVLPPHMAPSNPLAASSTVRVTPFSSSVCFERGSSQNWGEEGVEGVGMTEQQFMETTAETKVSEMGVRRTRAAFDPPPERFSPSGIVDDFSFHPGLIPALLNDKRKQAFAYSPISSSDIQKTTYPSVVDPNDPYLKSRLEKFYSELDEYRSGMVREHVELRRRKDDVITSQETTTEVGTRRGQQSELIVTEENRLTSMMPDGTFLGEASDSNYTGLGAHTASQQTEAERAFHEYRRLRSDAYHSAIPKGAPPTVKRTQ